MEGSVVSAQVVVVRGERGAEEGVLRRAPSLTVSLVSSLTVACPQIT